MSRPGLGIWAAACLLPGCGAMPEPDEGHPSAAAAAEYVGSQACAGCHREAYEGWLGSHHQLAMQPAGGAAVVADFEGTSFAHGGVRTAFNRRGERFVVSTAGPDGEIGDFEVRYTFGVEPLQQFLLELEGGRLQALGIAWDTAGERWFHLQPADGVTHEDPLHWTGPAYTWNFMCADCHSTAVSKGYDSATDTYSTGFAEVSVGCEACHGPGSRHVAWAATIGDGSGDRAASPLPGTGSGLAALDSQARQIDSCAPCHSRRAQLADGFTPERPFLDHYLPSLLEPGLYEADGQILDEVYVYGSFLQSRMYARGVTCGDCHEPHSAQLVAEGDALCTRCHNEAGHPGFPTLRLAGYDTPAHHLHGAGSEGSRCVSCHMPDRTYMVIDDRRDHGLRVPRPDLTVALGIRNACHDCHDDRSAEWARDVLAGHFGTRDDPHFAGTMAAARGGLPGAAGALAALAEDGDEAAIVRATALALMESYDDAGTALALERGLRDGDALVRIGALRGAARFAPDRFRRRAGHLLGDPRLAVRTEAARLLAGAFAGLPDESPEKSRFAGVLEEYLDTQRFNADRPEAHTNMANAFLALGDVSRAEAALDAALGLSADWVHALVNLADLYRATNRDPAGGELLERATALAPDAAEVKLARALWLVRQGRDSEALPLLAGAVELAPDNSHYAYVYAVALHSGGESMRALEVLDAALGRRPGDRALGRAAAGIARDLGDDARMRRYLEPP
ncbi:MAG: multiheme c-type cytochrome [Gammaproteobacteria bacterium]|nr:multiheme c-type cytochrome [Gammaproteobacteria bacterium]